MGADPQALSNPKSIPVDMDRIRSGIYLGSQAAEEGPVEALKTRCITHVLQLGTGATMQPTHKEELDYMCISVPDDDGADIVGLLLKEGAFDYMDNGRKTGCVLVHCQLGMSRSSTAVLAYLMLREGLSFWEALVDLLKLRKIVQPNAGFCRQLMGLELCRGDVARYKGPVVEALPSEQAWLIYIDKARSG